MTCSSATSSSRIARRSAANGAPARAVPSTSSSQRSAPTGVRYHQCVPTRPSKPHVCRRASIDPTAAGSIPPLAGAMSTHSSTRTGERSNHATTSPLWVRTTPGEYTPADRAVSWNFRGFAEALGPPVVGGIERLLHGEDSGGGLESPHLSDLAPCHRAHEQAASPSE